MTSWADVSTFGTISSKARPLRRDAAGKRCGPVEEVIAWAWRDELPKLPRRQDGPMAMAGGWDRAGRFAELLSLVDAFGVNQFGAVPDFSADSWPCADAQAVGAAVMALDDYQLELPDDWRPAPELDAFGGLGAKAVSEAWRRMTRDDSNGRTVLRLKPSELIIRRAVMGWGADSMQIEGVEQRFEAWANGEAKWFVRKMVDTIVGSNADGSDRTVAQNVELNGWSSKSRRPVAGAYRKPYLDTDPVAAIIARAEHEIWLSALMMVFDQVAGQLTDVVMLPSEVSASPWLDAPATSRVLPDLVGNAAMAKAERDKADALLAARFPRWFKLFEKGGEKIAGTPA